jgi:hypothetical protein
MLAQLAWSSRRCRVAHCSTRRRAVADRMLPSTSAPVEGERGVIALVLCVKVRWVVLSVVHANDDAKEGGDYGH